MHCSNTRAGRPVIMAAPPLAAQPPPVREVAGLAAFSPCLPAVRGEARPWKRGRLSRALAFPVHAARDARNVDVQRWRPHGQGYWWPGGTAAAGSWVLVDQATGNVQSVVSAGEFSRRFRPVDVFADVPGLPGYLGTVTAPDGTALVDLVLDRNPFMLANGPRRAARPHALMVPRRHRGGWSSAHGFRTDGLPDGDDPARRVVPQPGRRARGVLRQRQRTEPGLPADAEAASGILTASGPDAAITRIPGRTCSTLTCMPSMPNTMGPRTTSRRRLRGIPSSPRAAGRSVPPSAATPCRSNGTARGSAAACALRRSPGVVITAPASWAWTGRCG